MEIWANSSLMQGNLVLLSSTHSLIHERAYIYKKKRKRKKKEGKRERERNRQKEEKQKIREWGKERKRKNVWESKKGENI